jgi:signal peptide peptidase SppA
LADFIFSHRGTKPIISYVSGQMCSAAYWIGSSADKIVAFPTSQVGSIGVIIRHLDYSGAMEKEGVTATHIFAGKYKAFGNQYEPLSEDSKEYIQSSVDYYYSMFTEDVAKNRNVELTKVLTEMAEGRVFIGRQAQKVNLVDEIGNMEVAIQLATNGGNEMDVNEAVGKFSTKDILMALQAKSDVPKEVAEAIEASTQPKLVIPEAVQAMLDGMKAQIDALASEKEEAKAALAKEQADKAKAAKLSAVSEKLNAMDAQLVADASFVDVCMALSEEQFGVVASKVEHYITVAKETGAALFTTEGSTKGAPEDQPTTFDGACSYIAKRDNIDIEHAGGKAKAEFPALFDQYMNGGN